jgi:hypothetical protein
VTRFVGTLLVVLALLPATALAADTVGPGQVITDPAAETEQPPAATAGTPQAASAHPPKPHAQRATPPPPPTATLRTTPASVAPARAGPATSAVRPTAAARSRRASLPFTGVNAGVLALVGLGLLAAGSGLLAVLRQPVQ